MSSPASPSDDELGICPCCEIVMPNHPSHHAAWCPHSDVSAARTAVIEAARDFYEHPSMSAGVAIAFAIKTLDALTTKGATT